MKIKLGDKKVDTGFRSPQQVAAVQAIAARPEFQMAVTTSPPDLGGSLTYKGSFAFLWYNKCQRLTMSRISWTGRITKEIIAQVI